MRKLVLQIILSNLILFGTSAQAAFSLQDVTQKYLSQSMQIQSSRELHQISESDRWRRYVPNEPQFQYLNQDSGSSEVFGLALPISFPGKSIALSKLDSARENVQKSELLSRQYEAIRFVVQGYLDCASATASLKIIDESLSDLQTLYTSISIMYENGHSTQAERIGTELQLRQSKADLRIMQDKSQVSCEKLSKITGESLAHFESLEIPADVPPEILDKLDSKTADQARAHAAVQLAESSLSLATWNQLPDLNLGYSRNHYLKESFSPTGDPWTTTYGISVTVPILFLFHELPEQKRMTAQSNLDKSSAEIQLQQANVDQADAAREYKRSTARLNEIRNRDLALAETLVESTFSAYRSGKLGFAELMSSRKTLADLKNQELQLKISIINAHLRCLNNCSSLGSL